MEQLELIGVSNGYPPKTVWLVWEKPYEPNDSMVITYELYRDGNLIASSLNEDGTENFKQPELFDHDHNTNLFRKDSTHKLMYTDNDVNTYREYMYYVKMIRTDMEGNVIDTLVSKPVYVQAQ